MGPSDKATKEDSATATAMTKPNSANSRPADEGRKEMGRNTETSVAVVAMMAKNTSRVPSTAAARGPSPPPAALRRRWMFSSTTMVSSTTSPLASTSASSVSRFTEKPSSQMAASVPMSDTGMATAGTSVGRQRPRNTPTTATTITTESSKLPSTSRMAPRMNTASSATTFTSISLPWALISCTTRCTPSEISTLLDCACRTMPRLTTVRPSSRT
jgi:hypothetical protein